MMVQITNYGARILSLWVPASDGDFKDVVCKYKSVKANFSATDIIADPIVGRYDNRIG